METTAAKSCPICSSPVRMHTKLNDYGHLDASGQWDEVGARRCLDLRMFR